MEPIPSATPPDGQALCMSCGLCCDRLFTRVRLAPDDLPLARRAGVAIEEDGDGDLNAPLPCAFLRDAVCTVYPERYAACRTFTCKLYRGFMKGEVDTGTAHARVVEMRDRLTAVRASAGALDRPPSGSDDATIAPDMNGAQRRDVARLRLAAATCTLYANKYFRNVPDPLARA